MSSQCDPVETPRRDERQHAKLGASNPEVRMSRQRTVTVALAAIAIMMMPVGLQAALSPRSFFDDFPMGRGWIAQGGTYDEHLVRDVGVLFLAMIVVTVWAIWRRGSARPVAAAWLLQGVMHFAYHVGHLDGYDGLDKIGLLGSLVAIPILAGVALWADWVPARVPQVEPRSDR